LKVHCKKTGRFVRKPLYGVGLTDVEGTVASLGASYKCWRSMLTRAYSEKYKENSPCYHGVSVTQEWLVFSSFKVWFDMHYRLGFDLDKDLLGDGSLYSPETCVFLPRQLNLFLEKKSRGRNKPVGVRLISSGKFATQAHDESGQCCHIGVFSTESDARFAYLTFKSRVAETLAKRWAGLVDERALARLVSYYRDKQI